MEMRERNSSDTRSGERHQDGDGNPPVGCAMAGGDRRRPVVPGPLRWRTGKLAQNLIPQHSLQATGAILLLFLLARYLGSGPSLSSSSQRIHCGVASRLAEPGTAYKGTPWHNERTIAVETLGETKFARCDVHTVISEDGTSLIKDWIFLEEVPAVNIVVQTLEGQFLVFQQKKYAIPGETISPVGGFIDAGESPLTAAKREVFEELGIGSRRTLRAVRESVRGYSNGQSGVPGKTLDRETISSIITENANPPVTDKFGLLDGKTRSEPTLEYDADWVFLGRYRTAANRGGGFLYSYLLKNAVPLLPGGGAANYMGTGDEESQEILSLSEDEVMKALSEARFQEIKWAATFALAMLHLRSGMPACCGENNGEVVVSELN